MLGFKAITEKLAGKLPGDMSQAQWVDASAADPTLEQRSPFNLLKKLRGGLFLTVGYLLSPLSWWNDLIFNLPIAYLFGYLCSLFSPNLLLPCAIVGYWLSNVLGILLMQAGVLDVVQTAQPRNLKKELLMGILSSTAYTVVIVALVKFGILTTPDLFADASTLQWRMFFPDFLQ